MTVIIASLVGFLVGRTLWIALRQSWQRQPLMRTNYQGVTLPTAAGVVIAFALLTVEAVRAGIGAAGMGTDPGLTAPRSAVLTVVLGFTVIGLLDDLTGTTKVRGLAGHLRALGRGELTTGAMKLFVGAAISLVGVAILMPDSLGTLVVSAAVVALSANLFNLLDLRPGRATKAGVGTFAVIALAAGFDTALVPVALVIGAAAALMLDDLHERLMIGDTGANAIGAAIGMGLVTQLGSTGRIVALVVLAALNLLSEFVSFSRIIDQVAPLRVLDQIGRRRPPTIDVREPGAAPFSPMSRLRHTDSPIRATVGGAHEGSSTAAARPYEQDDVEPSDPRDGLATRPFRSPRDEPSPRDRFGVEPPRDDTY